GIRARGFGDAVAGAPPGNASQHEVVANRETPLRRVEAVVYETVAHDEDVARDLGSGRGAGVVDVDLGPAAPTRAHAVVEERVVENAHLRGRPSGEPDPRVVVPIDEVSLDGQATDRAPVRAVDHHPVLLVSVAVAEDAVSLDDDVGERAILA